MKKKSFKKAYKKKEEIILFIMVLAFLIFLLYRFDVNPFENSCFDQISCDSCKEYISCYKITDKDNLVVELVNNEKYEKECIFEIGSEEKRLLSKNLNMGSSEHTKIIEKLHFDEGITNFSLSFNCTIS
ncbi:hypothetical protein C0585_01315 [Candidatus Woesearchaeota archaeon]|nr:MAG: hypothetical protein C0585_01315 [Candidatus Woesearchaeota archaeon]